MKKIKKILAIIILIIISLSIVPLNTVFGETDNKPIFNIVRNLVMKRDETATLDITVNEKLEFMYFRAELDYDSDGFEITGIEKGEILPIQAQLSVIKDDQGKIIGFSIENDTKERIEINEGRLLKINITSKDTSNFGKYRIAWSHAQLLYDDSQEIAIDTFPGSVIISNSNEPPEKQEFRMIWNQRMAPSEEQTISVQSDNEMWINFMNVELLYDEDIEILDIEKGEGLPNDAEIIPYYNGILGDVNGFGIQSDNLIHIDQSLPIVYIKIKVKDDSKSEKAEFAIIWNEILDRDWNEEIADDNIINIDIEQKPAVEPEVGSSIKENSESKNYKTLIIVTSVLAIVIVVTIIFVIAGRNKK